MGLITYHALRGAGSLAGTLGVATLLAAIVSACGVGSGYVREGSGSAVLVVDGPPGSAFLWVDGVAAGSWARTGGAFEVGAGQHLLRVEAPGYLPYRTSVSVAAGEVYDFSVELWPCYVGVDPGCVGTQH